jgi:glycosyltransferase involved in cell wall biosynthesis
MGLGRKHKVCFVLTTPFAVNAFLRTHLLALSETYEVTLCVNTSAYPLVEDVTLAVHVCHIDIARKITPWQDLCALFQLIRCFRGIRPTVVHSMTPKAGLLAMSAAWLVGVPWRFHTFTGQVWANKTGLARSLLQGIDRLIAVCASQVFADSASQCRLLRDEGVVRDGQISMLGSGSIAGVDIKRFCSDATIRERFRQQIGTDANTCVFLFVGRVTIDKGVFDLIQAFRELASAMCNIELWVVGPDEEGLLKALQKSAEGYGAPFRWLGATLTPEHFMAAADVLVLPSYREGFGSVLIEGAACGIPSVAYCIDGVIDAVVDESTGLLVELGKISAFASSMKQLALDGELRSRLGTQARERAIRDFSSDKVTSAWLEFYSSQLKKDDEATS